MRGFDLRTCCDPVAHPTGGFHDPCGNSVLLQHEDSKPVLRGAFADSIQEPTGRFASVGYTCRFDFSRTSRQWRDS
jgi:hypothetical protein